MIMQQLSRRLVAAGLFWFFLAGLASAEQLTTVAVVDIGKVYATFFKDSQSVRDLEKLQQSVQDELNNLQEKLKTAVAERYKAQQDNRPEEVLRLEKEIVSLKNFITDYKSIKSAEIKKARENLTKSDSFMTQLAEALKFVALEGGFSLILDMENPDLLFWSPDVDVTDKVLERLKKTLAP